MKSTNIRTNVYVDGFNLYYGAAKGTPYKWVDLAKLCRCILPTIDIHRIRYFTALVKAMPSDQQTRMRQDFYLRALQTIPNLTIHYGHYLQSVVRMPLSKPQVDGSRFADVLKMEEKGSDVNIATYMLVDAFRKDCEQIVVITNDSDLAEPIRILNKEMSVPIGVFNPHTSDTALRRSRKSGRTEQASPSVTLKKVAKFTRDITSGDTGSHMALSQFPNELLDAQGRKITKPSSW